MKHYIHISEFANFNREQEFNLRRWAQVHWRDGVYTPNAEAERRITELQDIKIRTEDPRKAAE